MSEASVYRLLKAHDLITSPTFLVIKAANEFKDKTTAPNEMWQTDFTYLKAQVGKFISHYNHRRYHEGLQILTPADLEIGQF